MGKHGSGASDLPGNIDDDTWTKLLEAAASDPRAERLMASMVRNASERELN